MEKQTEVVKTRISLKLLKLVIKQADKELVSVSALIRKSITKYIKK